MSRRLEIPAPEIVGRPIWDILVEPDAKRLREHLQPASPPAPRFLLNFVGHDQIPQTYFCQLDRQADGFMLLGEPPLKQEERLHGEMLKLNNELLTLTRENKRKSRELERTLAQLKEAQARLVHEEKMASLGRTAAGIAHEINNPVAFVLSNQITLGRDFEDLLSLFGIINEALPRLAAFCPEVHEQVVARTKKIELPYLLQSIPRKLADNVAGLERVRTIVQDLRNFSRLDEGGFKPCDVARDIVSLLKFLTPLLQEQRVTVQTSFAVLPPLLCAPGPLNQAISNIITNAINASPPGATVLVSTSGEEDKMVITVQDQGGGIPTENLRLIFDPFFTTKPVGSGTGLGLSIAQQVVKTHKGEIRVESQVGQGTRVRIEIPTSPLSLEQGAEPGERNNSC